MPLGLIWEDNRQSLILCWDAIPCVASQHKHVCPQHFTWSSGQIDFRPTWVRLYCLTDLLSPQERNVNAVGHHDGSLCTQKQPETRHLSLFRYAELCSCLARMSSVQHCQLEEQGTQSPCNATGLHLSSNAQRDDFHWYRDLTWHPCILDAIRGICSGRSSNHSTQTEWAVLLHATMQPQGNPVLSVQTLTAEMIDTSCQMTSVILKKLRIFFIQLSTCISTTTHCAWLIRDSARSWACGHSEVTCQCCFSVVDIFLSLLLCQDPFLHQVSGVLRLWSLKQTISKSCCAAPFHLLLF